jgi:hypothetical protein
LPTTIIGRAVGQLETNANVVLLTLLNADTSSSEASPSFNAYNAAWVRLARCIAENVTDVRAHSHLRDNQLLGDLTVALALRHKPQDVNSRSVRGSVVGEVSADALIPAVLAGDHDDPVKARRDRLDESPALIQQGRVFQQIP